MKKLFWLAGIVVVLVTIVAGASFAQAQAKFEMTDLTITPKQFSKGEPGKISATVKNTGDAKGSHSVQLKIDGKVEATETVALDPGATKTVTFSVTKTTPGKYLVEVGNLKSELRVLDTVFQVTDLTISPKQVTQGDPVRLSVNVSNVGSDAGTYTLWLRIKKEVTLEPKASQPVSFTIVESSLGKYQLEIADLKGEFSVVTATVVTAIPWWHNWWIIGGIVGVIVAFLLARVIIRLRSY